MTTFTDYAALALTVYVIAQCLPALWHEARRKYRGWSGK